MSATKVKAKPAKPAKAKPAPEPAAKAKRKPRPAPVVVEPEPEETEHHVGLVGIATRSRSSADGSVPPKHQLFEVWLRDPVKARAEVAKLAAKFDSVKENTIKSWFSNWSQGLEKGYYPASLRGRERELSIALQKIAKAAKAS